MGANAQTAVPAFTAGQVLTAAQQTQINTGIPVFATTVTRDAAFDGTGEKALAEGQFAYIEATNTTQYYDGAAWQPVGASSGLTLVSATTIGTTVASVTVSSAFSSTYDNYLVKVNTTPSTDLSLLLTLGATVTDYYAGAPQRTYANTDGSGATNNGSSVEVAFGGTNGVACTFDLQAPNLAKHTLIGCMYIASATGGRAGVRSGFVNNTTQYTAFTLTTSSGTLTGGTVRVYGYANR